MNHALAHCNQQTLYLQIRCWARLCHLPNDSTTISVSTRQERACPGVIASTLCIHTYPPTPADNRGSASEKTGKEVEQEDRKHRKE
jgi:hypothetical protein